MIDKQISKYWLGQITSKLKGYNINTFSDSNLLFEYAIINDKYKIYYSEINNSLQLYKIISVLELFEKEANREELICSYGESEKSVDLLIEDIFKDIKWEEELINKDWNKYCLKSTYHESDKHEFYVKVHKVVNAIPTGFKGIKQLCFDCENFEGQNINKDRGYLRCSLIGHLYKIIEIPDKFLNNSKKINRRLSIFDFL